jgi:signal transduction histidine kinase
MPQSADIHDDEAFRQRLEEEKLAALAEFAAGAGHEINNPIAVICGRVELLLRQETHPERRRDLATIHAQARRVYEMIADLMLFARPPQPTLAKVDLAALLRELSDELQPRCHARGVEFAFLQAGEPLPLVADSSQLLVALRAVSDNALEALPTGGRLEIQTQRTMVPGTATAQAAELARIEIRDDGPGFDEHLRRHLFDPFFSGRAAGRGLGLGLAKCWRIVRMHGGAIHADSQPGQGATFAITLPLSR